MTEINGLNFACFDNNDKNLFVCADVFCTPITSINIYNGSHNLTIKN